MVTLVMCTCLAHARESQTDSRIPAEYVLIITGRELRGRFMGHNVYRATDYDVLPLNPDVSVQNPPNAVEAHLLALVRSHLYGGYFLYSYGWDLTRRLQARLAAVAETFEHDLCRQNCTWNWIML